LHRAVEHRALVAIAAGQLELAGTKVVLVTALDRGWVLYAHTVAAGQPLDTASEEMLPEVWRAVQALHEGRIAHGDLRPEDVRIDDGRVVFTGFGSAEFGASDTQLQTDIAQLLVATTATHGREAAVRAAIDTLGEQSILSSSRRLTKSAMPAGLRGAIPK